MAELSIAFTGTPNNQLLHEELDAALSANYTGVCTSLNYVVVIFENTPTSEDEAAAIATVGAHDPEQQTTEQEEAAERATHIAAVSSQAATMVSEITADIATIAGAPTSEQILTVIDRILDRQLILVRGLEYVAVDIA